MQKTVAALAQHFVLSWDKKKRLPDWLATSGFWTRDIVNLGEKETTFTNVNDVTTALIYMCIYMYTFIKGKIFKDFYSDFVYVSVF